MTQSVDEHLQFCTENSWSKMLVSASGVNLCWKAGDDTEICLHNVQRSTCSGSRTSLNHLKHNFICMLPFLFSPMQTQHNNGCIPPLVIQTTWHFPDKLWYYNRCFHISQHRRAYKWCLKLCMVWSVVAERSSLPDSSSGVSSRMWVRIPAVTLVSLSKTLNHNCFSPPRG